MKPDLNQMVIFVGVVEARSFTAAAKVLGIPKSTVSKRIGELEDRLGVRLLQRTTRRVKPTALGATYYAACQRIVADARAADGSVLPPPDGALRGLVRVTAPRLLEPTLAPAMEQFLLDHAGVSLDLRITNRRVDLIEEGIDLAIRPGALPDSSLVARSLGRVEHCLCASPAYLARRRAIQKPKDLQEHDCISFSGKNEPPTWTFERNGKKFAVAVTGRYAVSSVALVRRGILAGLGIGSLPEFVVAEDLTAGRLVRLLPKWSIGRGAVHLVYPSNRHLTPSVRALVDHLVATFGASAPWTRRAS